MLAVIQEMQKSWMENSKNCNEDVNKKK